MWHNYRFPSEIDKCIPRGLTGIYFRRLLVVLGQTKNQLGSFLVQRLIERRRHHDRGHDDNDDHFATGYSSATALVS